MITIATDAPYTPVPMIRANSDSVVSITQFVELTPENSHQQELYLCTPKYEQIQASNKIENNKYDHDIQ